MFCRVPLLHVSVALCCVDVCCVVLRRVVQNCVALFPGVFRCCVYQLRCVVLTYAVLCRAVFYCIVRNRVPLCCVVLLNVSAPLCYVDVCGVVVCCVVLCCVVLCCALFCGAPLLP